MKGIILAGAAFASFLLAACGSVTIPEDPPAGADLANRYEQAGQRLYAERDPGLAWADGSNWNDGISHQLPKLPIDPSTPVHEAMTCAQWETLEAAVFPEGEGYDRGNWHEKGQADDISGRWRRHLATTLYGDDVSVVTAVSILRTNIFTLACGALMK